MCTYLWPLKRIKRIYEYMGRCTYIHGGVFLDKLNNFTLDNLLVMLNTPIIDLSNLEKLSLVGLYLYESQWSESNVLV